ncbi:ImmA/IrrE family metallo-endopeptidase [Leucobacter viscericola]|uniref:ImmA/IrrE family metallo-endopeptidase n=1 Tax=Leucobacter viscericola TaxID=2714935 RepID=A0A6G7XGJ1_9MICO|nr:ImmA/IrrE family metallo-endopeptidase [Leucobacter viscericola]QIK63663.1 ImmA/IrrE family metallo-endopeptidase [Leucobacter viscericola]
MERLYDYATELGVQIEFADLQYLKRSGDYCHELRLIRIQDGMMPRKTRHTLGHELGHATHGDEPSVLPHIQKRLEDRADEWAAHFLIEHDAFREAEERHSGHIPAMAVDLYVLEKTVRAYVRTLDRIGNAVYISSKLGAGQWTEKVKAN